MATRKVIDGPEAGESLPTFGEFGKAVMQIADEKGLSKERVLEVVEGRIGHLLTRRIIRKRSGDQSEVR